jgi:hypothetical protein
MKTMNLPGFTADASLYRTSGHYRPTGTLNVLVGDRGVLPQRDNVYTTDTVCQACGCSVSGFVCNCGLRPSQQKLDCIQNGGPDKRPLLTRFQFSNVSNNIGRFF